MSALPFEAEAMHWRFHSRRIAEFDATYFRHTFQNIAIQAAIKDDDAARIHSVHIAELKAVLRYLEVFAPHSQLGFGLRNMN